MIFYKELGVVFLGPFYGIVVY